MAEGVVQLPPNSTGVEIRTQTGDGTNNIPSGVVEEVVTLADEYGYLQSDARFNDVQTVDQQLQEVLLVLRQILLTLALGFNIDPATPDDADQLS